MHLNKQIFILFISLLSACGGGGGPSTQTAATYSISGTISGAVASGVTVALSGTSSAASTTGSSGTFTFPGLSAGPYVVKPSLSGYTFSPLSKAITLSGSDVTGTDFTSTANATYTLSGTVSGDVTQGVAITLAGTSSGTTTTDSSGNYAFTVAAGTYTLTPAMSGYTFSPSSTTKSLSADTTGVNFTSSASTSSTLGDRTDYASLSLSSGGTYSSSDSGVSKQCYSYSSSSSDLPAVKVAAGGSLTLTNTQVAKVGDTSDTENSAFYGFNAGLLVSSSSATSSYSETGKATAASLSDCTITTSATGANGAFAFGEGATATLDHVTIKTTGSSNARGVDATYGGKVVITNSIISTTGGSCAALASDRYNNATAPVVQATNCTGTTSGSGSPGIYCTGTFTVTDCTLTATGSEAAAIEGLNSITLTNSCLSGSVKWGVMIYQSMSGDSSTGTGTFTMSGGTLTNGSAGPLFFVCDTDAVISLTGATLVNSTSSLLLVAGKASTASSYISNVNSSWGSNGGTVTFKTSGQALAGEILLCDTSSTLAMTLSSSTLIGAIDKRGIGGTKTLTLDAKSKWTASESSNLTTLVGVVLDSSGVPANVDAPSGVTITYGSATDSSGNSMSGTCTLASGGKLTKG